MTCSQSTTYATPERLPAGGAAWRHQRVHGCNQRLPRGGAGRTLVALTTEARDGHDFISDAVARGATGVIYNREIGLPDHEETVEVLRGAYLGPGDLLLVKASHGLAFGAVVAELVD